METVWDGVFCKVGCALRDAEDDACCSPDPELQQVLACGQGMHGRRQLGRRRGQAVWLQVRWCCGPTVLLLVIALAWWGSRANFISLVSVVIALLEGSGEKGQGWVGKG